MSDHILRICKIPLQISDPWHQNLGEQADEAKSETFFLCDSATANIQPLQQDDLLSQTVCL